MNFGDEQYLPLAPPFFALLAGVFAIVAVLLQLRLLQYAYTQLGVSSATAVFLLFASLLGSYVNIPIATLWSEPMVRAREVYYFGVPHVAPHVVPHFTGAPEVVLAVNVGGAVIPTFLSLFLVSRHRLWGKGLLATICVAAVAHAYAEPIRGIGIALPIFVAPIAATLIAAIISWQNAAALAYAGGSLGVLIGADVLNLDKLRWLGTPIMSIGGAGTFDGIFVTGVLSVLLASLIGARSANAERLSAS